MISPGNSHTSRGFFLRFRFCLGPVLCNSELSLSVMASARFLRCSSASSSRPSVHDSLESSAHLPCELMLSLSVSPLPCVSLLPWKVCRPILFLLSEGSSGLQVPVVLRADNPCFHSWGWLIVQPPVLSSLTDFFPWDSKEVVILIKGDLGLFDI
jgi:hypothetical protein